MTGYHPKASMEERVEARRRVLEDNETVAEVARSMGRSLVWVYRQLNGERSPNARPFGWKTRQIAKMAMAGLSDRQIAEEMGTTLGSVRSVLSKERARGIPIPKVRDRGLYVPLSVSQEARFFEEAVARDLTPSQLAAKLITAVIDDNLFNAVIDEG